MNKTIALILTAVLLLACTLLCGCKAKTQPAPVATEAPTATEAPAATEVPVVTEAPAATETTATDAAAEATTAAEGEKPASKGVILVQTNTQYGFLPLPAPGEADYVYPLIQMTADGTTVENDIHVNSEGFYMEYSTCDNQNCVGEGEVTFDNRDTRILGSCVLCLPNGVYLELYTVDEVMAMIEEAQAQEAAEAAASGETAAEPTSTQAPAASVVPAAK